MSRLHRKVYEEELERLQAELVKMQYWVRAEGARVAVVFEGRDAAGKGGSIRRIMEYLNPRSCRVAALPKPTEREQTAVVLPALHLAPPRGRRDRAVRPQLVQPRRRRDGDGLLHARGARPLPPPDPDLRAHARRGRDHPAEVLVLGERRRAGASLPVPDRRPDAPLEAEPDGPRSRASTGSSSRGRRTRCSSTPTSPRRAGSSSRATTSSAARINCIHHLLSQIPYEDRTPPVLELPPRQPDQGYVRPPQSIYAHVPDHAATLET